MTRPKVLTPDAAGRELAKVMRLAAQKDEQLRDLVKERKGEIAALHKRARELQGIVLGDAVQVELDTGDESEPAAEPAPVAAAAETLTKARKRKKGERHTEADEVRDRAVAYALQKGPYWLAELLSHPGAPLFVPGEWWPEVGLDGRLMHGPVKGKCPNGVADWRDCPTCLADASAGPEARR
jgi:hypothetical protein